MFDEQLRWLGYCCTMSSPMVS